jgi:hypothetical protein
MLLMKIDNTVDIITQSLDLAEIKNKNVKIKSLSKSLSEIYQLQKEIINLEKEFLERAIHVDGKLKVKSYKIKIKQISDLIDSGIIPFDRELNELKSDLMNYKNQFTECWKAMVNENIKPVINLLTIVKSLVKNDNQPTYIINKFNQLVTVQPSNKHFSELDNLIKEGKGILTGLHLNDSIIGFLEKVYRNQATVADLNNEVLSWLKENDLRDSVKLSFL